MKIILSIIVLLLTTSCWGKEKASTQGYRTVTDANTVCVHTKVHSHVRPIDIYYMPFSMESFAGMTRDKIKGDFRLICAISSEIKKLRALLLQKGIPASFDEALVRLRVEGLDTNGPVFVDQKGTVARGSNQYALSQAHFKKLEHLLGRLIVRQRTQNRLKKHIPLNAPVNPFSLD